MSTLTEMVKRDAALSYMTPDLPTLRYEGTPHQVFIWDSLRDEDELRSTLFDGVTAQYYSNMRIAWANAYTVEKYVPWQNMATEATSYDAYLLEDITDIEWLNLDKHCLGDPLPVRGSIYNVSTNGLVKLDQYYTNNTSFVRVKLKVQQYVGAGQIVPVWAYVNDIDCLAEYDTSENSYVLHKGIDPTIFPVSSAKNFYSYSQA